MFLLSFVGSSFGLLIGSMLKDEKGMNLAMPILILPLIVLAGYFKNT
jgi:ABC-type multidrug transport system permease subunit